MSQLAHIQAYEATVKANIFKSFASPSEADLLKSWSTELRDANEGSRWVTMNGNHILVSGEGAVLAAHSREKGKLEGTAAAEFVADQKVTASPRDPKQVKQSKAAARRNPIHNFESLSDQEQKVMQELSDHWDLVNRQLPKEEEEENEYAAFIKKNAPMSPAFIEERGFGNSETFPLKFNGTKASKAMRQTVSDLHEKMRLKMEAEFNNGDEMAEGQVNPHAHMEE